LSFLNSFTPLVIGFKTTMTHSRLFLSGALAITGIASAFGFATEAQAATFTIAQVTAPGFSYRVDDKVFSGFVIPTGTAINQFQSTDTLDIDSFGGGFTVNFNPLVTQPGLQGIGSLKYNVTIPAPFTNKFDKAEQSTQGTNLSTIGGTRTLASTGGLPNLVSTNASQPLPGSFSPGVSAITVTDSWNVNSGARINNFSDTFTQNPLLPEPQIPEPSAVLGLLALGLCGALVGRKKG